MVFHKCARTGAIILSMKILTHISRFLLGLIFLVFGLNGFLHFIPMPPPSGVAGQFLGAMFVSKYLLVVSGLQVISGALLLINRYVPLALTILGPIIVNILLFHGSDESGRYRTGGLRHDLLGRGVRECAFGVRRNL